MWSTVVWPRRYLWLGIESQGCWLSVWRWCRHFGMNTRLSSHLTLHTPMNSLFKQTIWNWLRVHINWWWKASNWCLRTRWWQCGLLPIIAIGWWWRWWRLKFLHGSCGNVAAILELDEHLNRNFKIFYAAPQESRGIPAKKATPDYFLWWINLNSCSCNLIPPPPWHGWTQSLRREMCAPASTKHTQNERRVGA